MKAVEKSSPRRLSRNASNPLTLQPPAYSENTIVSTHTLNTSIVKSPTSRNLSKERKG